ncbi:MAG TPA: nucleotidyltransferase family protein [Candidatus Paceibacterota bacterium]
MSSSEEISKKIVPILKSAGAKRASLFGSYARGDQTSESDVDILIEPPEGMTLFDMAGLVNDLEDVLGLRVDLLTYGAMHPRLEPYISKDAIIIF